MLKGKKQTNKAEAPTDGTCGTVDLRNQAKCTQPAGHVGVHMSAKGYMWKDPKAVKEEAKKAKKPTSLTDKCPKCDRELGDHDGNKCPPKAQVSKQLKSNGYCGAEFEGSEIVGKFVTVCTLEPNHAGRHENTSTGVIEHIPEEYPDASIIEADAPEAEESWQETAERSVAEAQAESTAMTVTSGQPMMLSVERARELLANSKDLDEVRDVRDKAAAMAVYMRAQKASMESQNSAAEIRLRAERRLGELSREIEADGRGRKSKEAKSATSSKPAKKNVLSEIGLKPRDAQRFEELAKIPEEKFEKVITDTKAKGERLTGNAPIKLVRQEKKAKLAAELRAKPVPQVDGRFDVIVMDPPWMYEKRAEDITQRGQISYPPMTQAELLALPVPDRAEKDCVLWIWTTNAFIEDAIELGKHWGFTRKTMMTWGKGRIDKKTGEWVSHMGNGDNLRGETEHCLMFTKGRAVVTLTNETTLLLAPSREHSRKPDEFYERVNSLCPGTKLDMFAREAREGYVLWGAETDKFKGAA